MPKNFEERIAIIGAGAAGLSAAYYLSQKGYKHITLFEKENHVGGKCYSHSYKNNRFDLGGIFISPTYVNVMRLVKKYGIKLQYHSSNNLVYNPNTKSLIPFKKSALLQANLFSILLTLLRFTYLSYKYRQLKKPGFANLPDEVVIPFSEFIRKNKLDSLKNIFMLMITYMGYGDFSDISAAAALKYLKVIDVIVFTCIVATGTNFFKLGEFLNGFQSLWEAVAKDFNVVLESDIKSISYEDDKIIINSRVGQNTFDKLIITPALPTIYNKIINPTVPADLVNQIKFNTFDAGLIKIDDFFYLTGTIIIFPTKFDGDPIVLKGYYQGNNVYRIDLVNAKPISINEFKPNEELVKNKVISMVNQMSGEQNKTPKIEFIHNQFWLYYPQVSIADIKKGFYDKINKLQGVKNTYYAGSLLSFETVELTTSYSKYLVETYF